MHRNSFDYSTVCIFIERGVLTRIRGQGHLLAFCYFIFESSDGQLQSPAISSFLSEMQPITRNVLIRSVDN